MKVDFEEVMVDIKGEPIPIRNEKNEATDEVLTLKTVCTNAIFFVDPRKQEEVSGEDKVKQYKLALTIQDGGEQELTVEDVVLLKKKVASLYGVLVAGQALIMLDG